MDHPLDGAKFKIIRAQEHLDAFNAEGGTFLDTEPYRAVSEVHGEYWWIKPHVSVDPPLKLSAIVGDCVTNARAALDYIVWQLGVRYANASIDERRDRNLFAMPIQKTPPVKNDALTNKLNGLANRNIPAAAIDIIKDIQPHNAGYEPLLWLHELVNHDKHRMPILTVGTIGAAQIGIEEYKGKAWLIRSEILKDGAAIKAESELIAGIRSGDVKVHMDALVYITCRDVAMPREPLDRALEQIIVTITNIIPRFESFF